VNDVFLSILNMSIVGSFVIVAVCLARILLKKAPKSVSYLLWLVVGFRLLFPFSIESTFSLIPFDASQPIPQNLTIWQAQSLPESHIYAPDRTMPGYSLVVENLIPPPVYQNLNTQNTMPGQPPQPHGIVWWPNIFAWFWLTGAVIMMLYGAISYYMLSLKMAKAGLVGVNVYKAENISTPFVLGVFKPKIYLPPNLKSHEYDYILLHEQTHISRMDHIVKLIAYFILALHWFNPLAWVSFLLMGKDMEMSCDEHVIKKMGGGIKKDYSMTLLSMATGNRIIGAGPLAFGDGGIKVRVKNVLNFRKSSKVFMTFVLILVVVLSIGLAMNRGSGRETEVIDITSDSGQDESGSGNSMAVQSTPYVGAAHETSRIVGHMPIPSQGWEVQGIQIGADHGDSGYGPYTLTVFYEPQNFAAARLMWEIPVQAFYANAAFLFEHIGNLRAVSFSVNTGQTGRTDSELYVYRWNATYGSYAANVIVNEQHWARDIDGMWTWTEEDSTRDFDERRANTLIGPVSIIGSRLYLDPIELIMRNDHERIEELWPDLLDSQHDDWEYATLLGMMPNGHYIRHLPGHPPLSFEIAADAVFEFMDTGWALSCTHPEGSPDRATSLENFMLARPWLADASLAGSSTYRRVPMFVEVNEDGQVVRVTEEFFLTQ